MAFDPSSATIEPQGFDPDSATMESSFDPSSAAIEESPTPETDSVSSVLGKIGTAVKHNIEPFIQHPLEAAYETFVPTMEDIRSIGNLAKAETYKQNLQPGSQEWYDRVLGYSAPLILGAAAKGVGIARGIKPETPGAAPEPVAPEPVVPRGPVPIEAQIGGEKYAQQISETAPLHGDVQYTGRPAEGAGEVPAPDGGEGVPARGQGEVVEGQPRTTEEEAVAPHPLQGQTYYRGTNPNRVSGEDQFYSAHKETAEEYSAGGPGGIEGTVTKTEGGTLPKNLYQVLNKEELAAQLGISEDLYGTAFDNAVKSKLQPRGYAGVRYEAGTSLGDLSSGGQEEIHVFSPRPLPQEAVVTDQPKFVNAVRTSQGKITGYNVEHGDAISLLSEEHDFVPGESIGWVIPGKTKAATDATFVSTNDVQAAGGDIVAALKSKQASEAIPQPAHYTPLSEPAVTVGEQRTTSTKNAVVDAEREARGLSPVQTEFSQSNPELWNQVQGKFEQDPLYGKKVVDGLLQDPARGITPFDEAALLREKVRVQNLREAAGDRADDASLEDWQRKEARDDYDRHEAYASDIDRATHRSGEVWGRFGQFRQRLALDDYSLEAMKRRTRVAKKGPLTLEESQELEKDTAAVADLTKQRNKRLRTLEEEQAAKRVQRRERLEQRIAQEKGLEPMRIKGQPVPPDVEIEILLDEMSKLKALKKERGRLPAAKEQTRKRIAEINQRMKDYGFSKLLKAEKLTPDKELLQLQYDLFQATGKLERGINAQKFKSMGKAMQAAHMSREILALPRQLMASTDFSAVLRQGGTFALTHPVKSLRAMGPMFRATATEKGYFAEMQKIRDRDNSWKYFRDGLELTDIHPRTRAGAEEPFQGVLGERIPIVSHSQRAYTLYLNRIRADWYDYMEKYLAGSEATPAEGKVIANAVNVMTGRGAVSGPRVLQGLAALNDLFFAPRWRISRFQTLLGQPLWTPKGGYAGTGRARALVASEYAKTLLAYGGIMAMLSTLGKQTIEGDGISAEFGKIKIGNTRIDLLAGLQQPFVLLNRLLRGQTKTVSGEVRPLYGATGLKNRTALDVLIAYGRSGLAPIPGKITDVMAGRDVGGKPVSLYSSVVYPGIVPLSVNDIHEAMNDLGAPAGAATGLASIFGAGVQTYQPRPTSGGGLYKGQGNSLYQSRGTKLYR